MRMQIRIRLQKGKSDPQKLKKVKTFLLYFGLGGFISAEKFNFALKSPDPNPN
jgi:hypothetical protein